MYDVMIVAEYIVKRCNDLGKIITNLKLQKILYFIQAEFLVAKHGRPCFFAEIEAWEYGPVVPEVYHAYKYYGWASIPYAGNGMFPFSDTDRQMMDEIIDFCADFTASQLVEFTHNQTPWIEAYSQGRNSTITRESIENFFRS